MVAQRQQKATSVSNLKKSVVSFKLLATPVAYGNRVESSYPEIPSMMVPTNARNNE